MFEHFEIKSQKDIRREKLAASNEGIIDYIRSKFSSSKYPGLKDNEVDKELNKLFNERACSSKVNEYLTKLFKDESWVNERITDTPRTHESCFANLGGKPNDNIQELVVALSGPMFSLAIQIMDKYKANTEVRNKAFKELKAAKSSEDYDKIYEKYEGQLEATDFNHSKWLKTGGKNIPAVGAGHDTWPSGEDGFYDWPNDQILSNVKSPTKGNIDEWKKNVLALASLHDKAIAIASKNIWNHFEDLDFDLISECDYEDEIIYGICTDLTSSDVETNITALEYIANASRALAMDLITALLKK